MTNLWFSNSTSNWNLEIVVSERRRQPEYLEKNLLDQRREPTENSTHIFVHVSTCLFEHELNSGNNGGRQVLTPLRHRRLSSWMIMLDVDKWTILSIWRENILGYLSVDIICSEKQPVFRDQSSRKTVSFEELIMSKEKYPSIFLKPNGGYCFYCTSNIFRNTHLGNITGNSPVLAGVRIQSRDAFRPIACEQKIIFDGYHGCQ